MQESYRVGYGIFTPVSINQFHDAFQESSPLQIKQSLLYVQPNGLFNVSFSRTSLTASLFITIFDLPTIIESGSNISAIRDLSVRLLETMLVLANLTSFNVSSVISENSSEINEAYSRLFY